MSIAQLVPAATGPTSEEFADLVFACSLLWKSVDGLTARLAELEHPSAP